MYIKSITEKAIIFDNKGDKIFLEYEHEWDCSEEVYADFLSIPKNVLNKKGKKVSIFKLDFKENIDELVEEVKDQGFMLVAKDGTKILVNCYDIQNGYYNSDLAIIMYEIINKGNIQLKDESLIHQYK